MTDLKNGIFDIHGFRIDASVSPAWFGDNLGALCWYHGNSKSGDVESYSLREVKIVDRFFDVDAVFIRNKLADITLIPYYDDTLSYEGRFELDCEWLRDILGEPTKVGEDGHFYEYSNVRVYSFIQRDLARNPAETFLRCKYNR